MILLHMKAPSPTSGAFRARGARSGDRLGSPGTHSPTPPALVGDIQEAQVQEF